MTQEISKTFDPAAIEARWYRHWEANGLFRPDRPEAQPYTIVNPPPNVTGSLHIGHALDNTLQDVVIRYERLRGKDALWVVGMDHAGIATQMVVERQMAERQDKRTNYSRDEFVEKVWQWKAESGGAITGQLRRLGCSMDWSREQFTMDPHFSAAVTKVFVDLYNQGLLYRDKRLVNWDPALKTAISDLEVENREVPGHMWHFKYPLAGGETYTYVERDADGNVTLEEERDYIAIATTRPETMLGDGAVAVHPSDARYGPIVGKLCEIPVGPKEHRRQIPIITDEYPDPDFGSGAVKITGAHDENDYGVASRNGIPMYRLMDEVAAMRTDGAPYAEAAARAREIAQGASFDAKEIDALNLVPDEYRGLDRYEARKRVVADIDADGLMLMVEDKPIMQPFGGTSTPRRSRKRQSRRCAMGGSRSSPRPGKRPFSTGWRTSSRGASAASSGGATGFPHGTMRRASATSPRPKPRRWRWPVLARYSRATTTFSTRGSRARCGPSPRSAGPSGPISSPDTTPTTC
jgi:valyl-tRNA synthetase